MFSQPTVQQNCIKNCAKMVEKMLCAILVLGHLCPGKLVPFIFGFSWYKKKNATFNIKKFRAPKWVITYHTCSIISKSLYSGLGLIPIHSKGILGWWSRYGMWYLISKLSKSFYNESDLLFLVHHWGPLTSDLRVVFLSDYHQAVFQRDFEYCIKSKTMQNSKAMLGKERGKWLNYWELYSLENMLLYCDLQENKKWLRILPKLVNQYVGIQCTIVIPMLLQSLTKKS